jgi:hypothetical protein
VTPWSRKRSPRRARIASAITASAASCSGVGSGGAASPSASAWFAGARLELCSKTTTGRAPRAGAAPRSRRRDPRRQGPAPAGARGRGLLLRARERSGKRRGDVDAVGRTRHPHARRSRAGARLDRQALGESVAQQVAQQRAIGAEASLDLAQRARRLREPREHGSQGSRHRAARRRFMPPPGEREPGSRVRRRARRRRAGQRESNRAVDVVRRFDEEPDHARRDDRLRVEHAFDRAQLTRRAAARARATIRPARRRGRNGTSARQPGCASAASAGGTA